MTSNHVTDDHVNHDIQPTVVGSRGERWRATGRAKINDVRVLSRTPGLSPVLLSLLTQYESRRHPGGENYRGTTMEVAGKNRPTFTQRVAISCKEKKDKGEVGGIRNEAHLLTP